MKSEQEIIEKLNIYKQIKNNAPVFTHEFTLASGAITALEWVLENGHSIGKEIKNLKQRIK